MFIIIIYHLVTIADIKMNNKNFKKLQNIVSTIFNLILEKKIQYINFRKIVHRNLHILEAMLCERINKTNK